MSNYLISPFEGGDFSFDEVKSLESNGIFVGPAVPNSLKRTVKVAGFTPSPPPSLSSSNSGRSNASATMSFNNYPTLTTGQVTLPTAQESPAALEFIGFNAQVANRIFSQWISRPNPDQNDSTFVAYAISYIRSKNQKEETDANPYAAMNSMGLMQEFADSLLNPRHAKVRDTESIMYWIEDTLRMRFKTIEMLHLRLKRTVARNKNNQNARHTSIIEYNISDPSVSSSTSEVTATIDDPQEAVNKIDPKPPAMRIAVEAAGPILPDHVVMYKGKAAAEVGEEFIQSDDEFNMGAISRFPGGDFNCDKLAWYWTEEEEVAEQYRVWAADRCPYSETWIIRIQIPKDWLAGLAKEDLWFSRDWKEYIWYCKKKISLPPKFAKYGEETDVMKGHICSAHNNKVLRIKKENVQTEIVDDFAMVLNNGSKASQVVFMKTSVANTLGALVRGKTHIAVTDAKDFQPAN